MCSPAVLYAQDPIPSDYWRINNDLREILARDNSMMYAGLGAAGVSYNNGEAFAALQNPAHLGQAGLDDNQVALAVLTPWAEVESSDSYGGGFAAALHLGTAIETSIGRLRIGGGLALSQVDHYPFGLQEPQWGPNGQTVNLFESAKTVSLGFAAEYGLRLAIGANLHAVSNRIQFWNRGEFNPRRSQGTLYDVGLSVAVHSQEILPRLGLVPPSFWGITAKAEVGMGLDWENTGDVKISDSQFRQYVPRGIRVGGHAALAFQVQISAGNGTQEHGTTLELLRLVIAAEAFDDERSMSFISLETAHHAAGTQLKVWDHVIVGEALPGIRQRRGALIELCETVSLGGGFERDFQQNQRVRLDLSRMHIGLHSAGITKLGAAIWGGSFWQYCARHLELGAVVNFEDESRDWRWNPSLTHMWRGAVYLRFSGLSL